MKGHPGFLRLRVGDYRIIYTVDNGQLIVRVVDAGNRGRSITDIDTCKGNASELPSFLWQRPGGAYFFCRPIPGKGGRGGGVVFPPMRGTPGLLASQRPYIYASPRSRHLFQKHRRLDIFRQMWYTVIHRLGVWMYGEPEIIRHGSNAGGKGVGAGSAPQGSACTGREAPQEKGSE